MTKPTKNLDDILDEALDDLECPSLQSKPAGAAGCLVEKPKTASTNTRNMDQAPPLSSESDLRQLSDTMQACTTREKTDPDAGTGRSSQDLNNAITETLKSLDSVSHAKSSTTGGSDAYPMRGLNFSELSPDPEMAKMLQSLWETYQSPDLNPQCSTTGSGTDPGDPFDDSVLESLVNQLLSKDILFEPLKELDTKYPSWLSEHHPDRDPKMLASQYAAYAKQAGYLHELILLWQNEDVEKSAAGDETMNARALDLLQKVQDCGPPPEDLLPKIAEPSTSGISSLFSSSAQSSECSIM